MTLQLPIEVVNQILGYLGTRPYQEVYALIQGIQESAKPPKDVMPQEVPQSDWGQIMSGEIDPVKYGVLWQKVQDLDKKVDKLETGMEELLALANQGRGGLWVGMAVVSAISTIVGYLTHWMHRG